MTKPILLVDFDGVIHSYESGWISAREIPDPPVPGALEWLEQCCQYFDVQIYSSRSIAPGGIEAMAAWFQQHIGDKTQELGRPLVIDLQFPTAKPPAFLTIDDRAIQFEGDFSFVDPKDLLHFKPWNRR